MSASPTCRSGRTCWRRARCRPGTFPLFTGIRVFDRDYKNPRIISVNAGFERELAPDLAVYADFTYAKGRHLTRFLNYNVHGTGVARQPAGHARRDHLHRANPFEPQLGDVFVTNSRGSSLYRGATFGVRKRYSQNYQLEANYVLSKDEDDDSNERDPFTDRSFNFYDLSLDYGPVGPRHPAQVQFLHLRAAAAAASWSTCASRRGPRSRSRPRRAC